MAAFVIPNHNNTRFFNGPLGNSGVEEIAIQQGITVLLEQSGDAGSPGSLPSLYSSNDNVASISKTTSSGRSSQRFTLFAKNSGAAVLNGEEPKSKDDCVFPLHVRLIERSGCEVCWLAAPKEINQKILDELPPAVCNRIKKNLPRDLTKVGQKKVLDQFLNADASLK